MGYVLKEFENNEVKITVEERIDGNYIATFWDKQDCLEFDRKVKVFETSGEDLYEAFDLLCSILEDNE